MGKQEDVEVVDGLGYTPRGFGEFCLFWEKSDLLSTSISLSNNAKYQKLADSIFTRKSSTRLSLIQNLRYGRPFSKPFHTPVSATETQSSGGSFHLRFHLRRCITRFPKRSSRLLKYYMPSFLVFRVTRRATALL